MVSVIITCCCGAVIVGFAVWLSADSSGYRHGQIDAMKGKCFYVLKEQPNGEMRWKFEDREEQLEAEIKALRAKIAESGEEISH
jgi:hypothetical protein